LHPDYELVIV